MRTLRSAAAIVLALSATTYVFVSVKDARINELVEEVDRLEQQRQALEDFARRVTASRRLAQVDILEQTFSPTGTTTTLLRFQEIGGDGTLGEPIYRDVVGDLVYFEAATLKFDHDRVGNDATEQTTSLAMFRRIFGDHQAASSVADLFGRGALTHRTGEFEGAVDFSVSPLGNTVSSFSDDSIANPIASPLSDGGSEDLALWEMFWGFMGDAELAASYGVRVAQVEAPAIAPKTGQTWQLTLDASGGLNVALIGEAGSAQVDDFATARP